MTNPPTIQTILGHVCVYNVYTQCVYVKRVCGRQSERQTVTVKTGAAEEKFSSKLSAWQ